MNKHPLSLSLETKQFYFDEFCYQFRKLCALREIKTERDGHGYYKVTYHDEEFFLIVHAGGVRCGTVKSDLPRHREWIFQIYDLSHTTATEREDIVRFITILDHPAAVIFAALHQYLKTQNINSVYTDRLRLNVMKGSEPLPGWFELSCGNIFFLASGLTETNCGNIADPASFQRAAAVVQQYLKNESWRRPTK